MKVTHKVTTLDPEVNPAVVYRMEVRQSGIHGTGVYAAETIPANRKVIEYTGERISAIACEKRGHGHCTYYFSLDRYWVLDGLVGGSGAEYINHSCGPNLISRIMKGHILYMSLRRIRKGEELTVDYHFSKNEETTPCHCGSKNCRSTINLKD
jgi:SET domain-containing protein